MIARLGAVAILNLLVAGFSGTKTYYLLGLISHILLCDMAGIGFELAGTSYPISFVIGSYIVHFYDAVLR